MKEGRSCEGRSREGGTLIECGCSWWRHKCLGTYKVPHMNATVTFTYSATHVIQGGFHMYTSTRDCCCTNKGPFAYYVISLGGGGGLSFDNDLITRGVLLVSK